MAGSALAATRNCQCRLQWSSRERATARRESCHRADPPTSVLPQLVRAGVPVAGVLVIRQSNRRGPRCAGPRHSRRSPPPTGISAHETENGPNARDGDCSRVDQRGQVLDRHKVSPRVCTGFEVVTAIEVNLHRHAVGVDGPVWFFLHTQGSSPPRTNRPRRWPTVRACWSARS
jgi:hypothetical protein